MTRNDINTVGIVMSLPQEKPYAITSIAKITFSKELLRKACLSTGDALSFVIKDNLLSLRYIKGVSSIPRDAKMAKIRTVGSCYISVSKKRFPELFKYNLSTKIQRINYKIENGAMVIDLSLLKPAESEPGFDNILRKPVKVQEPEEEIGFGRLSA